MAACGGVPRDLLTMGPSELFAREAESVEVSARCGAYSLDAFIQTFTFRIHSDISDVEVSF
eukprot:4750197-Pleurochrysis_carterae.AAC.1